jgi:uncharacterized damage-inducible protein DinB
MAKTLPFYSPMTPAASRTEVFLGYLDYYRSQLIGRLRSLPPGELRASRLPSGWTPAELINHLTYVEMRWLEWGFEGVPVADPWGDGDSTGDRWQVAADRDLDDLIAALTARAERTGEIVRAHDLAEVGQPGERWAGQPPATLERVLFHLLHEYARHLGHLDIVTELAGGQTGE